MSAAPVRTAGTPAAVDRPPADGLVRALRRLLPGWIGRQRWYADKGHPVPAVEPVLVRVLAEGDPALLLAVVRTGGEETYQLLVGVRRELPAALADAAMGRATATEAPEGPVLYEATADPELMGLLLQRLTAGRSDDSPDDPGTAGPGTDGGPVRFHRIPGAEIPLGLPAVRSTAEQSNTSIAYGDRMMLKVLRHLTPGPHPELELLTALQQAGDVPVAAPLAWMRTPPGSADGGCTLGILQEFVPSRGDGWALAVEEARACVEGTCDTVEPFGGFTGESHALGRATARVHAALAGRLGSRALTAGEIDELVRTLTGRLETALAEVPELLPCAGRLRAVYQELGAVARRGHPLLAQRIHGDLHLGQALRAESGWVLIDFEGEPGRPQEERRLPRPAVRDVASMLRSFDYAAHHALAGVLGRPPGGPSGPDARGTRAARRASAWAVHNRRAFCAGYTDGGGADPRTRPVLLRAFEADKAVYEALYEAHNRPDRLAVPLAAVRRIAGTRPSGG